MTQIIKFVPSNMAAPQFQVTLDGSPYTIVVTWNFAAKRYYINIYDFKSGAFIGATPLVGTPLGHALDAMYWDQNLLAVVATLAQPVPRPLGQIIQATIAGSQPDAYNGTFDCLVLSNTQFSYPMPTDPGQAVVMGSVTHYLNMISSWFDSIMIFRSMQFEVIP